jgi:TRAP transporter TAXI family solute receptor
MKHLNFHSERKIHRRFLLPKKKTALLVTAISLAVLIGALALDGSLAESKTPARPQTAWKWPTNVTVMTDVVGSNAHMMACAWGPLLEADTGMKVRVTATSGAGAEAKMIRNNMVDFGCLVAPQVGSFLIPARKGHATPDGGPFQLRVCFMPTMAPVGYFVRGDSDIMTVDDLKKAGKGLKVGVSITSPDQEACMDALLGWLKLDWEDVTRVEFGSWKANVLAVTQEKADVVVTTPPSPLTVEAASSPHGIRFLELDPKKNPEAAARWSKVLPTFSFARCGIGVKEAQGLMMPALSGYWCSGEDQDPELVYQLIQWFDDNFDSYKAKHPMLPTASIDNLKAIADSTWVPFHEGSIRYLKEKGMWDAANDNRQEYNIKVIDMYIDAYQDALQMAREKKMKVSPENKDWIGLWENHKKELGLPPLGLKSDTEIREALKAF